MGSFWIVVFLFSSAVMDISYSAEPYFWHITDLHPDPHYHNWDQPEWNSCNEDVSSTQGALGDYECDSPWALVHSALFAMQKEGPDPEFILWTGDSPPHPKDGTWLDQNATLEIIDNCTELMKTYFDVEVVVALGNHDYWPVNQLPADAGTEGSQTYDALYKMWQPWLDGTEIENDFKKGGHYTKNLMLNEDLRVIVLNTNIYYKSNDANTGEDPGHWFEWLENLLREAGEHGEKVYLVTHLPPGKHERANVEFFTEEYNTRFCDIISEYGDVIIASYAGHTHLDSYRLFYDDQGEPVTFMLIAPSVTPWRARGEGDVVYNAHNPAMRRVVFDASTYELLDVEQWYLDLNKYKNDPVEEANWTVLYSYANEYGLDKVTAQELHDLSKDFEGWASERFHLYYDYNTVMTSHSANEPCDNDCKVGHICAIQNVKFAEYEQCLVELDVSGAKIAAPSLAVMLLLLGICQNYVRLSWW